MPVFSRSALEASPLADLHALAAELGIDGFRRLRKADLVSALLERQGGEEDGGADGGAPAGATLDAAAVAEGEPDVAEGEPDVAEDEADVAEGEADVAEDEADVDEDVKAEAEAAVAADVDADADVAAAEETTARPRRRTRSRARTAALDEEGTTDEDAGAAEPAEGAEPAAAEEEDADRPRARRSRRTTRGRRRTARDRDDEALSDDAEPSRPSPAAADAEDRVLEGTVELLDNGSGFLRVEDGEDVYVSAAQVRRCELVDGDRVRGPVRPPRRSERFPSLVRVDTINGRAADEVAEGTPFEDLPVAFPTERFDLGDGDVTLKAIGWLTPLGRGSRVTVVGPTQAGKSEALRRLGRALAGQDDLEVTVVLAGARPEEVGEWREAGLEPVATLTLAASVDARLGAIERAVETAKRIAARGGDAVVLVDGLDGLAPQAARKVLAAARNVVDGGSLTVVATAPAPVGGETTIVALDRALTAVRRFPALDLAQSGTLRAELLVGEAGADAIAQARAAGVRHA